MIYLSKLLLRVENPQSQRDMGNMKELHRTIMSAFPTVINKNVEGMARAYFNVLFRVIPNGNRSIIWAQSTEKPKWEQLISHYPGYMGGFMVKEISSQLKQITPNKILRFTLRANPTIYDVNRKRKPLLKREDQINWLQKQSQQKGFSLVTVVISMDGWRPRNPQTNEAKIILNTVDFEGTLRITDLDQFFQTLQKGIGPGKAFGLGLLLIGPS